MTWNLGSVADQIWRMTDDIPSMISGTPMLIMINGRRLYMEQELDVTIGSVGIAEKYQESLLYLSLAGTHRVIEAQGVDSNSISLAEFSIGKGGSSNSSSGQADYWNAMGENALRTLKGRYNFTKALG